MPRKEKTIKTQLLAAQRDLKVEIEEPDRFGAMRQCLLHQGIYCRLVRWELSSTPRDVPCVLVEFHIQLGDAREEVSVSMHAGDFESIEQLLEYGWRAFVYGLFGFPVPARPTYVQVDQNGTLQSVTQPAEEPKSKIGVLPPNSLAASLMG